jgi:hypothetical protein
LTFSGVGGYDEKIVAKPRAVSEPPSRQGGAAGFESVRRVMVVGGGVGRKICRKALKSLISWKENEA